MPSVVHITKACSHVKNVKICHALISINHNWQCFSEIREWWVSTFSVIQFSPGWRLEAGQFSHYPLFAWPVMVTRQRGGQQLDWRLEGTGQLAIVQAS